MSTSTGITKVEASKRVVEETRRLYAGLLSKPLDEKQLARPTFKFIQEIAKSVSAFSPVHLQNITTRSLCLNC